MAIFIAIFCSKLYLRSLKNDGLLMFNNLIPYNAQMLATITRHQVGTIEKAIQIFRDLQLIEILDNGAIYMTNIQILLVNQALRLTGYEN
ncbi:primosome component and related proteins [Streptococcus agalactiae]|uniref:Primosome component and related proteins n=1 Tax=Streptococcus agalactiae TaxID=1311 RepID=A0A7Z7KAF0_STRAG|nr:primosome component and related proteins [Streptococcus agalactiae]